MKGSALAAVLVTVASCVPQPDQIDGRYVDVEINEPFELSVPGGGTMVADAAHWEDVHCYRDTDDGRRELSGGARHNETAVPTTRDGTEWYSVGRLPLAESVTVTCEGPSSARLQAQVLEERR